MRQVHSFICACRFFVVEAENKCRHDLNANVRRWFEISGGVDAERLALG